MSMTPLEFLFDFSSAYSYLAACRIEALGREIHRPVKWRAILLGAVFAARGTAPPQVDSAKLTYLLADLSRSAGRLGLPFVTPPVHPFNSILAARCFHALDALCPDSARHFAVEAFESSYVRGCDLSQPDALANVAATVGLDASDMLRRAGEPEAKARLKSATNSAIDRGVFGAPTMFLDGEMFWGVDRFDHVRERVRDAASCPGTGISV